MKISLTRKKLWALLAALAILAVLPPADVSASDTHYEENARQRYCLNDLLSQNESSAKLYAARDSITRVAGYFPEAAPVNKYYGGQLNNPERYIYHQLEAFYANATTQRGISGHVEHEMESGYPFSNYTEEAFAQLYDVCNDELMLYWMVALQAFIQDNPQYDASNILFYGACYLVWQNEETGLYSGQITIRVNFDYNGSTADLYDRHEALENTLSAVTCKGDTVFEKVRLLHEYLCKRTEYEYVSGTSYTAYGALVEGKAVCQGYALAFKLLCDKFGIPCQAVAGQAGAPDDGYGSHMWNAVKMENGKWYALDATWDDSWIVHYDFCLVGSGSIPEHYTDVSFGQSHNSDMSYSCGDYSGELTAPALSAAAYGGVPFDDSAQKLQVTFDPAIAAYDGWYQTPDVTVKYADNTLEEGVDYSVTYQNNIEVGTATAIITGEGSFTGSISRDFSIKKSLAECTVSVKSQTVIYNGKPRTADVVVKDGSKVLSKGRDYTISYQDNIEAGTAKIILSGEGDYTGSVTQTFEIKKDFTKCGITMESSKLTYTGQPLTPSVTVKDGNEILNVGTDYTITYQKNTNVGKNTAVCVLNGTGIYKGSVTKKFTIVKADQTLSYTTSYEKTYGDARFVLGVKLEQGNGKLIYKSSDPRIAAVNNNGRVTIAGTGIATITVKAAATDNYKAKSASITITVVPGQQIIKSLKSEKTGKKLNISVRWKADSQASGYQIQYSTGVNFKKDVKTIDVKTFRTASKKISGLKTGKSYYIKVRSYKNVKSDGKTQKLYGKWSIAAKTKK